VGLRTTTVGSWPKPRALRVARWRHAEGEIDDAALRAAEDAALREVLALQDSLGLDLLVDGQMDRGDMISHFAERLAGFERGGIVRCWDNRYYRRPRIVGDVSREGAVVVEGFERARTLARRPLKAVITGPYTLMDWSFDEHYGSRAACCLALADVLAEEARALVEAGAEDVQIDEPAISGRPDELPWIAEALGRVSRALEGKARSWLHVCYGDFAPLLPELVSLPVDVLSLELSHASEATLHALRALPATKGLAAGVVDAANPEVESAATIRARIERVLRHVPAERLWAAPDAGLRALPGAAARAKIEALLAAARG